MRATESMVSVRNFHFKVFFSSLSLQQYYYLSAFCYNLSFETRPERTAAAATSLTNRRENVEYKQLVKLDERQGERAKYIFFCC